MAQLIETFDISQILQPAQEPQDARQDAVRWGPNLSITYGQAVGLQSSTNLMFPLNQSATDGTQIFKGFAMYTFTTDAASNVYYGPTAAASYRTGAYLTSPIWKNGIFDPQDLLTAPTTGTSTAEVDTITPGGTITQGDINTVVLPNGAEITFTTGGTTTATAVVTGLKAAWNANPVATALATASGTTTLILTAVTPGVAMNLVTDVDGTGTLTKAITTAPVTATSVEVDTFTLTNVTTGDVHLLTVTYPDDTTTTLSYTVPGSSSATTVDQAIAAAWNANAQLAAWATASGTTTLILTGITAGNPLNVTYAITGTGTVSKAVTTAAAGRSIAAVQTGQPGAYVMHNGFWRLP